jgi:signal transduction histidine kinase
VIEWQVVLPNGIGRPSFHALSQIPLALAFVVAGWLLTSRRPTVVIGWLALAAALGHAFVVAGPGVAVFLFDHGDHVYAASWAVWFGQWGEPLENVALVATWAVFPSGRFPRGRLGLAAWASVVLTGIACLYGMFGPLGVDLDGTRYAGLENPLHIGFLPRWQPILPIVAGLLIGSAVMIVRWLRATGEERQVLRWLAVVNAVGILLTPVIVALPAGELIASVGVILELIVIAAVVVANQVYGLTVVLHRALVYTLLTAIVAAVYGAGVGLLALAGQAVGGAWTVVAALVAAFSLTPARTRVQQGVNRFLYGERDEPYAVATRIAARLEAAGSAEQLLPGLLDALVGALRLPSATVEMRGDDGDLRIISHGGTTAGASVRVPLVHQGTEIGALVVGLRSGQHGLGPGESRLMRDVARQVAVAVANVMLTEALVCSRERIVSAAEEERRRLRRDLHDGLGPTLTAAATKVDAATNLTGKDLARARTMLGAVRADLTTALGDLRRLVYALRPPVLDELGLLGALREQLGHSAVPVTLTAPADLAELPAAVEIAAYRIIAEAVTNVTRHSDASRCEVTIECAHRLTIEVRDDGTAGGTWTPGVGLTSMRERVTALGGTWLAGPTDTGGRVVVELPLSLAGSAPPHQRVVVAANLVGTTR